MNQVLTATVLDDGYDIPEGFNLSAYWRASVAGFRSSRTVGHARIRVSGAAIEKLRQRGASAIAAALPAEAVEPDEWRTIDVPIESLAHAEAAFLSLAAEIEVLGPPALRARMIAAATRLVALYDA